MQRPRDHFRSYWIEQINEAGCGDDTDDGIMEQLKEVLKSGRPTSAKREICDHRQMNGLYASKDTDTSWTVE